jgi:DNA repair protein RecO (recombination protein O)
MQAAEPTRALLLRSVDYGDTDRVVTLLTERFGRVSGMARGARRSQKRFGGALSPLCVLSVDLKPGRGELWTLAGARIERPCLRLLSDLPRMNAAFAAIELLRTLTPEHEPDAALFELGCALLDRLEHGPESGDALFACFALRLLALSGMAPRLDRCGRCGRTPRPDQSVELDAAEGRLACRQCGGAALRLSAALRARLAQASGPAWIEAAAAPVSAAELAIVHRLLDATVEARLGRTPRTEPPR